MRVKKLQPGDDRHKAKEQREHAEIDVIGICGCRRYEEHGEEHADCRYGEHGFLFQDSE